MPDADRELDRDAFARAVRKLFTAAGTAPGVDCLQHAVIAQAALKALGIEAQLRAGYAAWRVDGVASNAVVAHHPKGTAIPGPDNEFMYHAWLQVGQDLVDFTTYQLAEKVRQMDAADGQHTPVSWVPEYLWVPAKSGASFADVRDGRQAGLYHYKRDLAVEGKVRRIATLDPGDVRMLLTIYTAECEGPVEVYGPSNMP